MKAAADVARGGNGYMSGKWTSEQFGFEALDRNFSKYPRLEVRLALLHIVLNYKFEVCDQTKVLNKILITKIKILTLFLYPLTDTVRISQSI